MFVSPIKEPLVPAIKSTQNNVLGHVYTYLHGDQITAFCLVDKAWNQLILEEERKILIPLRKIIPVLKNFLDQNNHAFLSSGIQSFKEFIDLSSLSKIEDAFAKKIKSLALITKNLDEPILQMLEREINCFPQNITHLFKAHLKIFQTIYKKDSLSRNQGIEPRDITTILHQTKIDYCRWKIQTLNNHGITETQAWVNLIYELASKEYFNAAINLSLYHNVTNKTGPIIVKYLIKGGCIASACRFSKRVVEYVPRAKVILEIASHSIETCQSTFGSLQTIFFAIRHLGKRAFKKKRKGLDSIIFALFLAKEKEFGLKLIEKTYSQGCTLAKISKKLTTSGFCEEAVTIALMIKDNEDAFLELKSRALMAIAFDFARASNFTRAYEVEQMVPDLKWKKVTNDTLDNMKIKSLAIYRTL